MKRILSLLGGVVCVLGVLVPQMFFLLDEREQAIITQFGAYVRTVTQPGLHTKVPFVHAVHRFDRRVLATDAQPAEYLTLEAIEEFACSARIQFGWGSIGYCSPTVDVRCPCPPLESSNPCRSERSCQRAASVRSGPLESCPA
jgi:SPFH domain / Band 7 family